MWSRCDENQIISCKISYKTVTRCTLMRVLFLRVKLVNQESLEEMECLAKMEFQDYQGSRCVLGCVCESMCVLRVVFIRTLSVSPRCNLFFRVLLDLQASWV